MSGPKIERRWLLWLVPVLASCGAQDGAPGESATGELTAAQVGVARKVGLLPSGAATYAALEIFDAPGSTATDAASCTTGGGINNQGVVVGWDCLQSSTSGGGLNDSLAFKSLPSGGSTLSPAALSFRPTQALTLPSGTSAIWPRVINDRGHVLAAGYTSSTGKYLPAVLWKTSTPTVLAGLSNHSSVAGMTNDANPIVFGATGTTGNNYGWFKYDTAGTSPTALTFPSGVVSGSAYGVSSRRDVVGVGLFQTQTSTTPFYAFAWVDPQSQWIDMSTAMPSSTVFQRLEIGWAVNANRKAVGSGILKSDGSGHWYRHAYQQDLGTGKTIDLGTLPGYSTYQHEYLAKSINAKGHVVGTMAMYGNEYRPLSGYATRAFLWTPEWGMRDLSSFIDPALGITLQDAFGINDHDEIVGWMKRPGHGYRLYRLKVDVGGPEFFEPTDGQDCSAPMAINSVGDVAGYSDTCDAPPWPGLQTTHPWVSVGGASRALPKPSGVTSMVPYTLSDDGFVPVGSWNSSTGQYPAYLYRPGAYDSPELIDLPSPGASVLGTTNGAAGGSYPIFAVAAATGSGANLVQWGRYQVAAPGSSGTLTAIPQPASGFTGEGGPYAMNKNGDMAGWYTLTGGVRNAMVWTPEDGLRDLNALIPSGSGWFLRAALAMNNSRQIVGFGTHDSSHRAFRVDLASGNVVDLGTLEYPHSMLPYYQAHAINNAGQVVGTAGWDGGGGGYHLYGQRAFIHTDEGGMTDLNDLVPMPSGWVLATADGINDHGDVTGIALQTSTNVRRAYKVRLPSAPSTSEVAGLLPISYTLASAGRVSVNIYKTVDGKLQLVRELLHGAPRKAGSNVDYWNGRDDEGVAVETNKTYTWKLLATPGFTAEYSTSPGTSFPPKRDGPFWAAEAPGAGKGASAIAVDATGLYVGGTSEIESSLFKQGRSPVARKWSAKIPFGTPVTSLSATATSLWLYGNTTVDQNGVFFRAPIYRFPAADGSPDVVNGRQERAFCAYRPAENENPSDMAAVDDDLLVFTYPGIGKVRWLRPGTPTAPTGNDFCVGNLGQADAGYPDVSIPGARSVAVSPDGTAYVVAGQQIWRIPAGTHTASVIVSSGLTAPNQIAVKPTSSELVLYVVDGNQIKRFKENAPGDGGAPDAGVAGVYLDDTWGDASGRPDGAYDKTKLRGITDLAVSSDGGLWVAEGNAAPVRVAHFSASKTWLEEWYGGQPWSNSVVAEPDDPRYVWMVSGGGGTENGCSLMRLFVDHAGKSWSVHSTYRLNQQTAGGLLDWSDPNCGQWEARVHDGQLYLATVWSPSVYKVDRAASTLKPSVLAITHKGAGLPQWAKDQMAAHDDAQAMLWTDKGSGNGSPLADGVDGGAPTVQTDELQFSSSERLHFAFSMPAGDLSYLWVESNDNKVHRLTVSGWTAAGAPEYSHFPNGEVVGDAVPARFAAEPGGQARTTYLTSDAAGNVWGAFNAGLRSALPVAPLPAGAPSSQLVLPNESIDSFIVRYNPDKSLAWTVGRKSGMPGLSQDWQATELIHTPIAAQAGALRTLRRIYGVINGSLVFGQIANSWPLDGVPGIYVYNQDGLYAGQVLGAPVDKSVPAWRYGLSAEGISGSIVQDGSGNVFLYGTGDSEARAYKITGWTGWVTSTGTVSVPASHVAAEQVPEAFGPAGNGTGLLGQYFATEDHSGAPLFERVDPTIKFRWNSPSSTTGSPTKAYESGTAATTYSVRWTGFLVPRRTGWHMFRQEYDWGFYSQYFINGVEFRWRMNLDLSPAGSQGPMIARGLDERAGRAQWLEAGTRYPVELRYTTTSNPADPRLLKLEWSEPESNAVFADIPTSQLFPR